MKIGQEGASYARKAFISDQTTPWRAYTADVLYSTDVAVSGECSDMSKQLTYVRTSFHKHYNVSEATLRDEIYKHYRGVL